MKPIYARPWSAEDTRALADLLERTGGNREVVATLRRMVNDAR